MDLQEYPEFQEMDVAFVSIAFDNAQQQADAIEEYGIEGVPMLIDSGGTTSQAYGVLEWAVATGEPGHTFVLVDETGTAVWVQDYGAPENRGVMYVDPAELVQQMQAALEG